VANVEAGVLAASRLHRLDLQIPAPEGELMKRFTGMPEGMP
jgi:hypothetical protein